jgi:hypothetical protein
VRRDDRRTPGPRRRFERRGLAFAREAAGATGDRRARTIAFSPLSAPARFSGCDDLVAALGTILSGWDLRDVAPRADRRPVLRLSRTRDGRYRRVSPWRDRPSLVREKVRRTLVEALCGAHFELIDWYAREHRDELCLHAAAVSFDGLVVFPAVQRAGKSVLTVELARRGVPVFGDDVVPVDLASARGIALGIAPRLRPPLPEGASPALRAFVEAHRGPGRKNRLYVALPEGRLVPFGASAPVRAVVLLDRRPRGRATLSEADPADALETLVLQNFQPEVPAPRAFDVLHRVASGAECLRLSYARTEDAADRLVERFWGRAAATPRAARPLAEAVA